MNYVLSTGETYRLHRLLDEDKETITWLIEEAEKSGSADAFNALSLQRIEARAKCANKHHFSQHPLYKIQQDLVYRLSVEEKEKEAAAIDSLLLD